MAERYTFHGQTPRLLALDVRRIAHYRFSAYRDMEGRLSVRTRKQWDIGAYIMGVVIIDYYI